MVEKTYSQKVDEAWKRIKPVLKDKMIKLATALGIEPEISEETSSDEYTLNLDGEIDGKKFGIEAVLAEEIVTEGEGDRFAVAIRVIGWGGKPIADYAPYNYTAKFWTNDINELENRIDEFDVEDAAKYVKEQLAEITEERCKND
jgi:hypothetical protein